MVSRTILLAASLAVCVMGSAQGANVYANNASPGDSFTNASGSNQGQSVGATGWHYNNVRNNGIVGINTNYARSGNGSAYLETTQGPGGASSKADIEFLGGGTAFGGNVFATSSLGRLGDLTALSYDWYRDSASTNSAPQHPALRILIDADGNLATTGDRGGLVFELAYNGVATAATNTWVTNDVFNFYGVSNSANVWNFGFGIGNEFGGFGNTLQQWVSGAVSSVISSNSAVLGVSTGVGSGWGPFKGAVDNITLGFNGSSTTSNFEVNVVPLPAAAWSGLALMGAMVGVRVLRKRRSA
jgi:hypothetical protein